MWRDPEILMEQNYDNREVGIVECAICVETFDKDDVVSPLPCHMNHLFHTGCIRPWLLRNRSCPLCKLELQEKLMRSASESFMLNSMR